MAAIARGSKASGGTTFIDGTTAYGSEVEVDFNTIYTAWNNTDAGTTKWTTVNSLSSSSVPLTADNSTGSQDVADFKVNGVTKVSVGSGGLLTASAGVTVSGGDINISGNQLKNLNAWKTRRPVLQYSSGTVVNIETGLTGTAGQLAIQLSDGTYATDSTSTHFNIDLTRVASATQSGLFSGSIANNTWYPCYVWLNGSNLIGVAHTLLPLQTNFATLNSNMGTNGWQYLGLIRNGDNNTNATGILKFSQVGNYTCLQNVNSGSATITGIRLANTAGATSLTYTYASGTGAAQIPANLINGRYLCSSALGASGANFSIADSVPTTTLSTFLSAVGINPVFYADKALTDGCRVGLSASAACDINLAAWFDGALGVGPNPLL